MAEEGTPSELFAKIKKCNEDLEACKKERYEAKKKIIEGSDLDDDKKKEVLDAWELFHNLELEKLNKEKEATDKVAGEVTAELSNEDKLKLKEEHLAQEQEKKKQKLELKAKKSELKAIWKANKVLEQEVENCDKLYDTKAKMISKERKALAKEAKKAFDA